MSLITSQVSGVFVYCVMSLSSLARATVIYVENFQFAEQFKILMYKAHKLNKSNVKKNTKMMH